MTARLEDLNCEEYSLGDVEQLLVKWFTESLDQLSLEAVYHTSTGDRSCTFNRDGFNRLAAKLKADSWIFPWDSGASLRQSHFLCQTGF